MYNEAEDITMMVGTTFSQKLLSVSKVGSKVENESKRRRLQWKHTYSPPDKKFTSARKVMLCSSSIARDRTSSNSWSMEIREWLSGIVKR
ncbi:hypothetical protein AVEN_96168-1 [Araneus ventricosus]|uniref:Uncharacterized protein n=1 Tax=Araneus ventricosus TaxID=182803 RepID=A0A4Y2HAF2_ARAVE|nr:hypothetical protein AVEN_96168-1 [Araneus ventricosus]